MVVVLKIIENIKFLYMKPSSLFQENTEWDKFYFPFLRTVWGARRDNL